MTSLAAAQDLVHDRGPGLSGIEYAPARTMHEFKLDGEGGTWMNAPRGPGSCTTVGCFVARDGGFVPSDSTGEFFVGVAGSRVADNFSVSSNQITELCWWGSYVDDLIPTSDAFRIAIYTDDTSVGGGLPGTLVTGGFQNLVVGVNPGQVQRSPTGQLDDDGNEIHEFHVTLNTPINVTPNSCLWLSIININTGAARVFNWATDDGNSIHDDGVAVGTGGTGNTWPVMDTVPLLADFAFCVNDLAPPQQCGSLIGDCTQDIDAGSFSCQGISGAGGGFQSSTSAVVAIDNFTPTVSGNVTEICFAGFYDGEGDFQRTAADQFQVNIYGSQPDGLPDTSAPIAQFSSATDDFDFGILFPFSIHTLHLSTPLAVTAGQCLWIEILNDTPGNPWIWSWGGPVDNLMGLDGLFDFPDGIYTADEVTDLTEFAPASDMAFCMTVDISTDPTCLDTTPPANDECFQATPVTVNGASVTGTIRNATAELGVPPCGFYSIGETGDVFHTVTTGPQAQQLTATTCNPGTEIDTVLNVYCFADGSSCFGGLLCVAGGDDTGDDLCSTITWDAAPNTTYAILVAGRNGGGIGAYELTVTGQASVAAPAACEVCDVDTSGATLFESAVEGCGDDTNDVFNTPGFDCSMLTQTAGPGTTVVGEAFADGALGRDLDFFRLPTPAADGGLLFTVEAEQPMLWVVWELAPGACPDDTSVPSTVGLSVPCEQFVFAAPVQAGLDYLFQVVPLNFNGAPCFTDTTAYKFSVATAPEGACCVEDGTCSPSFGAEDCALVFDGTYAGDGTVCGDPGVCDATPSCVCEFDGVAGVNVFDLLSYLDLWFPSDAGADIDGVAGVDVFDLLFYLDCWFPASAGNPCP